MRHLKLEILALIRYAFMGTGNNLALFRSTFASFFSAETIRADVCRVSFQTCDSGMG